MANHLKPMIQRDVIEAFNATKSVRQASRLAGVCRSTVRHVLRREGLSEASPVSLPEPVSISPKEVINQSNWSPDYSFLERLFASGRERGETSEFERHIKALAEGMIKELGISESAIDMLLFETALSEYIVYRRFHMKALAASQASYEGPYMKAHDKLARAIERWTLAAQRSLESFHSIIRSLEIKHRSGVSRSQPGVFIKNAVIGVTP